MQLVKDGCVNENNPHSMFLKEVKKKKYLTVLKKKMQKTSDYNDIDMTPVKDVIEGIKMLMHNSNLSFHTGFFTNKMKIAKVACTKAGQTSPQQLQTCLLTSTIFQNIRKTL